MPILVGRDFLRVDKQSFLTKSQKDFSLPLSPSEVSCYGVYNYQLPNLCIRDTKRTVNGVKHSIVPLKAFYCGTTVEY